MPNRPTYGELAFGSSGVPPGSIYRIAPANNRLQKNMFGDGYSEFMDYGAIDAFPESWIWYDHRNAYWAYWKARGSRR
jgi:hypothetical protein